ncbi:MAG: amidohydrolase family protein [Deltaproteobacteria bacterium]|nr:amidohydrolase family protein [Deltaproteobacteria bacterium]
MFLDAPTTMAVITSWPAATCFPERELLKAEAQACGLPLSNDAMRDLREWVNALAKSQRVINQIQVMPNDNLARQIEGMYAAMEDPQWRAGSWKCYPAWRSDTYQDANGGADGYYLDDPIGIAFIEAGLKLGVPNFAVHKGLPIPGFDVVHNRPVEIGRVAKRFPEANFVIYHSAISAGTGGSAMDAINVPETETGPYVSTGDVVGVNMLIRALIEEGLITENDDGTVTRNGPLNVYAEMGSAWSRVMRNPNNAQHYMGKLLKYFGPDNIVWGTDCILGGSPKGQIDLFKAFSITDQFQNDFGYPAMTNEIRAKIFGLNAARIYGIKPDAKRCVIKEGDLATAKLELDHRFGPNRTLEIGPSGPRTREEFWAHARYMRNKGLPG